MESIMVTITYTGFDEPCHAFYLNVKLTVGEVYTAEKFSSGYYLIKDDNGSSFVVPPQAFVTPQEWREIKLSKILNDD